MNDITKLGVYNCLSKEIQVVLSVLSATKLSFAEQLEATYQWISNKDFTIIGLYSKAPRYVSGIEIYQEFFTSVNPDGSFFGMAIREDFTDVISPRMLQIPIQVVDDGNNQIFLGGDFTDEVFSGTTHTILDSSNSYSPIMQANVIGAMYISGSDATLVQFDSVDLSNVSVNDIAYFQNGENLTGIDHEIKWFDVSGNTIITKTYYSRFQEGEAAIHEFNRRQITVNQMISSSDGSAVQPHVKAIYMHYKLGYIDDYINLGKAQEWADAIDNETDVKINVYLDIVIPFTDIEGNTIYKEIRDWIKDELYKGYKQ